MNAKQLGKSLVSKTALMSTAVAGGAGFASGFIGGMLSEKVPVLQRNWWAMPLVVGLGGHVVKSMVSPAAGCAMLGSAGTMAYYNRRLSAATTAAGGVPEAAGVQDVGDWQAELRSLPDAAGVQVPSSNPLNSMSVAA